MKKPIQYSCHKSKNRRSNICIKDINIKSSFFISCPKGFESVMEYQVIFQNGRIADKEKISVIHYCHNFFQRDIISAINFMKVFINQTRFQETFICGFILCQKRGINIFTKLVVIINIIYYCLQHLLLKEDIKIIYIFYYIVSHICQEQEFDQLSFHQEFSFFQ